jgi:hypothetical protein
VVSVTVDRVDALRRHVADAVTQTSRASTLPEAEQDRLLEQACAESCELLTDWLASQQALAGAAAEDVPLRELLRYQEPITEFLSPLFADALERAARGSANGQAPGPAAGQAAGQAELVRAARAEVDRAIRGLAATARRHPRLRSRQLRQVTTENVSTLRDEACQLARQYAEVRENPVHRSSWRRKALRTLKAVTNVVLPLAVSLLLSVGGPQQVGQNVSVWVHAAEAVVTHDLAAQARPGVSIAPPHIGPVVR